MPNTKTRTTKKTDKPKVNVAELVTNAILDQLRQGVVPWRQPFSPMASGPTNVITGKPYRGINALLLGMLSFGSPYWATRGQIIKAGGTVPKGLPDAPIVVFKPYEKTLKAGEQPRPGERVKIDPKTGKRTVERLSKRMYWVVNASMVEGITLPEPPKRNPDNKPLDDFKALLAGYKNGPSHGINTEVPCCLPGPDKVLMPHREQYESDSAYCQDYLHELVHSTGHKSRLNRIASTDKDSKEYAREELVAEIGACFLMHGLQIDPQTPQAASYIAHWLTQLESDQTLILSAAQAAQKAVDRIKSED